MPTLDQIVFDNTADSTALRDLITPEMRCYLHLEQPQTPEQSEQQIRHLKQAILSYITAFGISAEKLRKYDANEILDSGTFVGFYQGFRGRAFDIKDYEGRKAGDVHLGCRKGKEIREEMKKYGGYLDFLCHL